MQFKTTTTDEAIKTIIENGIEAFYEEVLQYMQHNNDHEVLIYANEQTLAGMFVYGLIRNTNGKTITALQEFGTEFESGCYGRPDIFLRIEDLAMYIECKYDRKMKKRSDHWDIEKWLAWDRTAIYSQCENYYKAEKLNETYTGGHYILTMVFKLINDTKYFSIVDSEMIVKESVQQDRDWYYAYKEFPESEKYTGLEVYGTFKRMDR